MIKKSTVAIIVLTIINLLISTQLLAQSAENILSAEIHASPPAVGVDGQVRVQIPLTADSNACSLSVQSLPLDVMLVIDRSSSMDSDNRWGSALAAARQFIGSMNNGNDQVGIVTFNERGRVEQPLSTNLTAVSSAIDRLGETDGRTDIRDGIETAGDALLAGQRPDAAGVIILLSDGNDNDSAIREAESYRAAGIRIITIGVGDSVDAGLMTQVASTPSDYYAAPNSAELNAIYSSIAETIQRDIGVTEINVSHQFDETHFELISSSISPDATLSGNTIRWTVDALPDGEPVILRYRLKAIQAGSTQLSPDTTLTFIQCENASQTLTLDSPTIDIIPPPPPPEITPLLITGETCEAQCIEETIRVAIPNVENQLTVRQLDVAFLFDLSGSMGDELNVVKRESAAMLSNLRNIVADTQFAAASFVDYPGFNDSRFGGPYGEASDYAWRLDQDMTESTRLINDAFSRMLLLNGGDDPEAYTRALHESISLGWRPGSQRMVVLFGDAFPHDRTFFGTDYGIDPGIDEIEGTDDDLNLRTVVSQLAAANISVLAVDTNGGSEPTVTQFMRYVAEETGGRYFALNSAESIPEAIQTLVGGQVASINSVRLSADTAYEGWLTRTPREYTNILYDGRILEFRANICPQRGGAERGEHTFDVNVLMDEEPIASVPLEIVYRPICLPPVDLFVADHSNDDGTDCSNLAGETFWRTPEIVTRQLADNGRESEPLRMGKENFIYVHVHNRGYETVDNATVTLLWNRGGIGAVNTMTWEEIDTQTLTVEGESDSWSTAFAWTAPSVTDVNFLVRVNSPEDSIKLEDNIACENNLALFSTRTTTLKTPSLRADSVGGDVTLEIVGDKSADLILDFSSAPANTVGTISFDQSTIASWAGDISGATHTEQGISFVGSKQIVLSDLPLEQVSSAILRLGIVVADDSPPFTVDARLYSADIDFGGTTIEINPLKKMVPSIGSPTMEFDPRSTSTNLLLGLAILTGLMMLILFYSITTNVRDVGSD